MSPTIHREAGYIFYLFSADVAVGEPPHVHVGQGTPQRDRDAKLWLDPVRVAHSGQVGQRALQRIRRIVERQQATFLEDWDGYQRQVQE